MDSDNKSDPSTKISPSPSKPRSATTKSTPTTSRTPKQGTVVNDKANERVVNESDMSIRVCKNQGCVNEVFGLRLNVTLIRRNDMNESFATQGVVKFVLIALILQTVDNRNVALIDDVEYLVQYRISLIELIVRLDVYSLYSGPLLEYLWNVVTFVPHSFLNGFTLKKSKLELALKFIDTEQFQRLRDLKQLGFTNMVYPGAVHSRFEHSVGVYWLAGNAIEKLKAHQGLELDIDQADIQTVKLAGLLHDVGHGPFSHLFEREFLPRVNRGSTWSHEDMSLKMIDYMVDEHNIDIDSGCLKKVKEMIIASSHTAPVKTSKEKLFLYDIVANGRNGIDVDKFDYIVRDSRACGLGCNFQFERLLDTMQVIDNEICYRAKEYLTVHKLFYTRADLHRTVYTHAKVKAIELMFVDALVKANDYLGVSSFIHDPSEYWKLDDSILKTIEITDADELKESRDIIRRIRRRDLYQIYFFGSILALVTDRILWIQNSGGASLREEDLAVSNVKIDLTKGSNSPLERYTCKNCYY
ncbi:HD domain-containing metal-dependent phosphohydrolase family protein [Artemisia annua]|uniref:HD domain-containing metal-dependent phosphohydrolase family protein n=1 Tax=Artemisia annua TaxID=35608 RepID=A0A2U1QM05_ARTAN|nr:HD domain-containing metal-dependent phosphohydrolase family protein [Artemisia annua]